MGLGGKPAVAEKNMKYYSWIFFFTLAMGFNSSAKKVLHMGHIHPS